MFLEKLKSLAEAEERLKAQRAQKARVSQVGADSARGNGAARSHPAPRQ